MDSTICEFKIFLKAEGKSDKTIRIYTDAARKLAGCQAVTDWSAITKAEVRKHMAYLNSTYSPAYASNQYRALRIFFAYLEDEDGIDNPR